MHNNPYRFLGACAWAGPVFLVLAMLFWGVMGHNLPPFSAAWSPEVFVSYVRRYENEIRAGMILTMVISPLYLVWGAAVSKVMEAVHGPNNILAELQVWGAGFTTLVFAIPCGLWIGVTFRADTMDPATLQLLFDAAWTFFDPAFALTTLQFVAFGICFLTDPRPVPLIPRWVSWLGIWAGLGFALLVLMPFFKDGPFSRSGLLNYWVEFSLFFIFAGFASFYILQAIKRLKREHAEGRLAA